MPQEEIQPDSIPEEPKMRSEARGLCAWYLCNIDSRMFGTSSSPELRILKDIFCTGCLKKAPTFA